ncbi:conserved hypothetical protein [Ricinus communis]|uniref:RING-type E3 ubiquitin transferase n=1 Tax=Ricinus communis TaxID=3988 RepID=B9RZ96_RICCO|nr:conserved hypothetical protein [Ricinus communis]|eukprot:XP_002519065.1 uncharacterized protein LOC8279506 [Ricinus communis]
MGETSSTPQLSPLQKCNNKSSLLDPSKTLKFSFTALFLSFYFLLLTTTAAATTPISPSNFLSYYTQHCNDIVPESPSTNTHINFALGQDKTLHFDIAYFTGGNQILPNKNATQNAVVPLSFHPKRSTIYFTQTPHVVILQATLRFHFPVHFNSRNLREIRFRPPRIPVRSRSLDFELYGLWSMETGKLCMVGSSRSSFSNLGGVVSSFNNTNVVLKLKYPVVFSNVSSLISGVLESVNDKSSLGYFEPISILGIPHFGEYNYTLINKGNDNVCFEGNDRGNDNLHLEWLDPSTCLTHLYRFARNLKLEYGKDCHRNGSGRCNPFGGDSGILPKFMTIQGIRCERGGNGGIQLLIGFSNSVYYGHGPFGYERVFDPHTMFIGEGVWDEKKDKLCVVACRVLKLKYSLVNASVGDCSIQLSLWFSKTLTIRERNTVVGQISSGIAVNETGYFDRIGFHGSGNMIRGLTGLKYKYTMLDRVNKFCPIKKTMRGAAGKAYPNAYSTDMRFLMSVRNVKGQIAQGFSSPLFVGDQLLEPYRMNDNHSGLVNISYSMTFTTSSDFQLGDKLLSNASVEISAEGTYDKETGVLCMIGCSHLTSDDENSAKDSSVDCDILVNIQFSPLNAKGRDNTKGTIKSMRGKMDSVYFRQLEISSNSIYKSQATESIWRMDMEITMVLVSNTLACVFVGLQLYHVKKHPDVLPFISFVMLIVLTLGYMIPLLLNFEAFFIGNHNRQNIFLESGGWLELNEVLVRVVTMIAFLLQFRLFQLSCSARYTDGRHKSLWVSEKRVLYLSLPLYIGGGLIAWYAHQWRNSYTSPYLRPRHIAYQQHYQWKDIKSYGGFILDGFLLPQIMFNVFLNCKENSLASSFYVGKTIVRLLPHAYDLYRAHSSSWSLDLSYIYGSHKHDFYSTTWDIIIPFVGLLLAAFIYLQQRFGGRCFIPRKFRETSGYEKVPVASSEEVRVEAGH